MNKCDNTFSGFMEKLTSLVAQLDGGPGLVTSVAGALRDVCGGTVLLWDAKGAMLVNKRDKRLEGEQDMFAALFHAVKNLERFAYNLTMESLLEPVAHEKVQQTFASALPLVCGLEKLGVLCVVTPQPIQEDALKWACEGSAMVCGLSLKAYGQQQAGQKKTQAHAVKQALDSLTFSELEATLEVFRALGGTEGRLIASHLAKDKPITRSAIVNALRKLQSASIVETRSLGAKGTYIKVKNMALLDELNKFN